MNVHLAKVPFHVKTLCEGLEHICLEAGVVVPECDDALFESNRECFQPTMEDGEKGPLLGKCSTRLDAVRESIHAVGKTPKQDSLLFSKLALLEYQTVMHDLFHEVLMNKNMHFCQENIDGFMSHLKQKMTFFGKWKEAQLKRKEAKEDNWAETFLAPQTWTNLRCTVCGFFQYAQSMLKNFPSDAKYIPMLASNTSSLEATFSLIKSMGGQNAQTYATRVSCKLTQVASRALEKSRSYGLTEHMEEANDSNDLYGSGALQAQNTSIEKDKDGWMAKFDGKMAVSVPCWNLAAFVPPKIMQTKCTEEIHHNLLSRKHLTTHFLKALAPGLSDYWVLAKYSGYLSVFEKFASLSNDEEKAVDDACIGALSKAIPLISKMVVASENYAVQLEKHVDDLANGILESFSKQQVASNLNSPAAVNSDSATSSTMGTASEANASTAPGAKTTSKTKKKWKKPAPKKPAPSFPVFVTAFLKSDSIKKFENALPLGLHH